MRMWKLTRGSFWTTLKRKLTKAIWNHNNRCPLPQSLLTIIYTNRSLVDYSQDLLAIFSTREIPAGANPCVVVGNLCEPVDFGPIDHGLGTPVGISEMLIGQVGVFIWILVRIIQLWRWKSQKKIYWVRIIYQFQWIITIETMIKERNSNCQLNLLRQYKGQVLQNLPLRHYVVGIDI